MWLVYKYGLVYSCMFVQEEINQSIKQYGISSHKNAGYNHAALVEGMAEPDLMF